MMKHGLFLLLLFLLSLQALFCDATVDRQVKPNIVIIFFDDMGYWDLESYGATQYDTPNTTRMAAEGMRFTHFYVPQARCSASRAALLTGAYPNRVGGIGVLNPWSDNALDTREETIADLLKKEGYQTAMMGKWHLGHKEPHLPVNRRGDAVAENRRGGYFFAVV